MNQVARLEAERDDLQQRQIIMDGEMQRLRSHFSSVEKQLSRKIEEVRSVLQCEVDNLHAEIRGKESRRAKEAEGLVQWVEARAAGLENLDALDLSIEGTRVQEGIRLTRERLATDPEMALPVAVQAVNDYQTAHLECERRLGVIAAGADHVEEVAAEVERRARGEELQRIFPQETARLLAAAAELRARAGRWRQRSHWNSFDVERQEIYNRAHRLSALALALETILPTLTKRLEYREQCLREAAAVATEVLGLVDRFEIGYANPQDPKSPRLLRAFVGRIHLDAYLDLDGTYSYETYGFDSVDACESTSRRVGQKLADRWQVTSSHFNPANPQSPTVQLPPTTEGWREVADEVQTVSASLLAGTQA
jgi:hypothetical protein